MMAAARSIKTEFLSKLWWWALSVPVYIKILGVGAVVAVLFGTLTFLETTILTERVLHRGLARSTYSIARSLSSRLERPLATRDLYSVNEELKRTLTLFPDVRYAVVRDPSGDVLAHTFLDSLPEDLVSADYGETLTEEGTIEVFGSNEGLIFNAAFPVLDNLGGSVQLGISDAGVKAELSAVRASILWSLVVCCGIGASLAILLTHIVARPIRHLAVAVEQIGLGNFGIRVRPFGNDEIGNLASAFNTMAAQLESYRKEVQEKEQARQALLKKFVRVQEEERKSISRELHDEVGQGLSAALLAIHENCKYVGLPGNLCQKMELRLQELIDVVHKLAWQMRPSILDDYGLCCALERHAQQQSEQTGLQIDCECSCPSELGRLPDQVETTLYRVAQEAVHNVIRHARASRVSLVVLRQDQHVILLVEDDGCGFQEKTTHIEDGIHLGLTGIKERVALCGGSVAIESAPGSGCTVRVRIPLG
jgi:signal transduction histidine kinase